MLNLLTIDIKDRKLLEESYEILSNENTAEVVTDVTEKGKIFNAALAIINVPANATFSFQNLFKVEILNGSFYVAQCLFDFGFPVGSRGAQTFEQKYFYQLIGITNLSIDLGSSQLRPETKIDKLVRNLFKHDIDFVHHEKFYEKYYVVSNEKENLFKSFDKKFIETISKYDDVVLITNKTQMFISFENEMNTNQAGILKRLFSSFKYLVKSS